LASPRRLVMSQLQIWLGPVASSSGFGYAGCRSWLRRSATDRIPTSCPNYVLAQGIGRNCNRFYRDPEPRAGNVDPVRGRARRGRTRFARANVLGAWPTHRLNAVLNALVD
jgi:hypothetical protein